MASMISAENGQRLEYVDHGGDGPAVLLLHSFLMDSNMFSPPVAALGDAFRLIAMDERGHGNTPANGPFDFWDVAGDALALLDHLEIDRATMVGTSQGGFVGMRAALLAPERVAALAVMGTSAAAENPEIADSYRQLQAAWEAQGPVDAILDVIATICLGDMQAPDWKAKWRDLPTDRVKVTLNALVDRDDLMPRLSEITCPTLVLHGANDAAYSVTRAEDIVNRVPNAEPLVVVEGGAHFLSFTDPDAVNAHLRPFLAANA